MGDHAGDRSLVELCISDEAEELLIAREAAELFGQLFHRVDRIHRVECSPNHGDRVISIGVVEEFFAPRTGLSDIDRGPNPSISEFAVED